MLVILWLGAAGQGGVNRTGPAVSPAPQFSHEHGFYREPVVLTLTVPGGNGIIRYTRNGSDPGQTSIIYTTPILIDTTTVIKARTFTDNPWPSPVITHTFLINDSTDLPVFSISTDPKNLWDPDSGIYVEGRNYVWGWGNGNFWQDWEKEAFVEFFEQDREVKISQSAGLKISGALTRTASQKSLRLIARSEYGPAKFNYPFFKDKPILSFNEIKLRTSGNDWAFSMMKDGLLQTMVAGRMDIDYQAYRPSIVFLNGVYWGIHNIREMIGNDYIEENHGFDKNNLDLLTQTGFVKEGDFLAYEELITFIRTHDVSNPENYQWITKRMDIQEFINYDIAQIFFANYDWPAGNIKYWKPRIADGIWRWIIFDLDFAFEYPYFNSVKWATRDSVADPSGSTDLFRILLGNPEFSKQFVKTFQYHLSTTFQPDRLVYMIDSLQANIDREMKSRHIKRWEGYHGWTYMDDKLGYLETPWLASYDQWLKNVEKLRDFARKRQAAVIRQLQDYFQKGNAEELNFVTDPPDGGLIFVDNNWIDNDSVDGSYFAGEDLACRALPAQFYRFDRWEIRSNKLNAGDTVVLIPPLSRWKYLDTGIYPDEQWRDSEISSAWPEGRGILGYNNDEIATELSYGSDPANKHVSYLFTGTFRIQSAGQWAKMNIGLLRDDGAVVYLNGVEVIRSNLPEISDFNTLASSGVDGLDELTYHSFNIPVALLRNGDNKIAVEVHQASLSSPDLTFDLSLKGVVGNSDTETTYSVENPVSLTFDWATEIIAHFSYQGEMPVISINEVMPANQSAYPDRLGSYSYWIELFNAGNLPVSLCGLFITDNLSVPGRWQIRVGNPELTVMDPYGYQVLVADGRPFLGPDHLGFSIGRETKTIGLSVRTPAGYVWIDTLTVPMQDLDVSFGHFPDGVTGPVVFTQHPTPGNPNIRDDQPVIEQTRLLDAYPNPFQDAACIRFEVREESPVLVCVRNLNGTLVRLLTNRVYSFGRYDLFWDGKNRSGQKLPAGIYLVSFIQPRHSQHIKLVLIE